MIARGNLAGNYKMFMNSINKGSSVLVAGLFALVIAIVPAAAHAQYDYTDSGVDYGITDYSGGYDYTNSSVDYSMPDYSAGYDYTDSGVNYNLPDYTNVADNGYFTPNGTDNGFFTPNSTVD